jgi:tungstate transport system substrate-binding protein
MGEVLTMAEEMGAYTLTDRGTYLARQAQGYSLPILVEGDPKLYNPYHVIAVSPVKYPEINNAGAEQFIDWITSAPTQAKINAFTNANGQQLFYADSEDWNDARP